MEFTRPTILGPDGQPLTAEPGTPEAFQNETLRPVLKMLHERVVDAWHRYAERQKGRYYKLNRPEQIEYVRHALKTNRELRSFYLGLVSAHMTAEECKRFRGDEKELSRRALSLVSQRLEGEQWG